MEGETTKSPCDPIIDLSNDDDEDEDVEELFNEFVSKVERFVAQKEVVLLLKLKFAEARPEFVSSAEFKKALGWRTKQLNEKNVYIYTGDICILLAADSKQDSCTSKSNCEKLAEEIDASSSGINYDARQLTREEAAVSKTITQVTIDNPEEDKPATSEEKIIAEVATSQPSTSSAMPSTRNHTGPSKLPLTPQKRRRLIRKLEGKLKHISEKIKILNQEELSLDEMSMNDSTYIQECRLKGRFTKIWVKLCNIKNIPPDTRQVTEREVKCPQTGFPEIDRAMNKFLKRIKGRFPDRFDIKNVFLETNKKHGLKMTPEVLDEFVDNVFVKICEKFQKRRKKDFAFTFGSFLTDNCRASNDPALRDPSLLKKLEENNRANKRALDEVFNRYAHYAYGCMSNLVDTDNPSSSGSENTEPENRMEGKTKGRCSHISVAESSDNECDDFGLEIEDTNDSDSAKTKELFDSGSLSQSNVKGTHSDSSENDLDDFVIKRPHRVTERTQPTESKIIANDSENSVELQSNKIDLGNNCTVVELPPSVLAECIYISVEQTSIAEIHECNADTSRSTQQRFEAETTVAPDGNQTQSSDSGEKLDSNVDKKDLITTARSLDIYCPGPSGIPIAEVSSEAVAADGNQNQAVMSAVEDHEVVSVLDIPQCNKYLESKHEQNSDSGEKIDSNVDNKLDLVTTARSLDIYSPGSSGIPIAEVSTEDRTSVLTNSVQVNSSDSLNLVDDEVSTEKCSNENRKHEISQGSVPSRNDKSIASRLSGKPTLVIRLTPVSLKGQESCLLSSSTKKRKAKNGLLDGESPLKIFRNATLENVGNKFSNVPVAETDTSKQKSSCEESVVSARSENDEQSEELFDSWSLSKISVMETHSVSSEHVYDLDDFVIKKPHRVTERTQPTESKIDNDSENSVELQSNKTDLGSNCTVVELPPSVSAECTDISVEQTSFAEIHECNTDTSRSTQQHFEAETTVAPDGNQKQAVVSVVEDHEVMSVPDIPQCNNIESNHEQNSDSGEKLHSNVDKKDFIITARSFNIYSPGSSSIPIAEFSSDDTTCVLMDSIPVHSSNSLNLVVDDEVSTDKCSNANGIKEISQRSVPSRNDNSIASRLSGKPTLVICLTPVSLKGRKSCLLSSSTKKRKVENGLLDGESPLKMFRNATLGIVGKKNNVSVGETAANRNQAVKKDLYPLGVKMMNSLLLS